jgi:hypothetical protein
MPHAKIIFCEKSGRWAAALRRALGEGAVPICETRSLEQCEEALRAGPSSLVAVEATAKTLEPLLALIARGGQTDPFARFVALLDADLDRVEPLLREAGAVDVLHSLREAPTLARLAQRHLTLVPQANRTLGEAIAERLPWKRLATSDFAVHEGRVS